eukprot:TRINITY_DN2770_c1_g2_i1.p1 TRINITY_DN2770_c1_g2~~TRINITY_DN2770_c1_g2_i1.p1  ORF type:complete len:313 (-),score=30.58 TRINITY_DN2770_c1_g2_i1:305-1243(-)
MKSIFCLVIALASLFSSGLFKDGNFIRVHKGYADEVFEDMEAIVVSEASDDCSTNAGCACLKRWSYRGMEYENCANPDSDYKSSWCQVDIDSCTENNGRKYKSNLRYYGYCTCQDSFATPSPVPSPSIVSDSMLPIQTESQDPVELIGAEDCLTIINTGCTQYHFFMTFTDGELIESKEYVDYQYYQSSGWWMLDNVLDDYTRWCSPTESIGLYIAVEDSRDFESAIKSSKSIGNTFRCMSIDYQFDYVTYHYNRSDDGHAGTTTFTPFYVDMDSQVREPECGGIGGEFREFQLIPKNTILYVDETCQFVEP